MGRPVSLLIDTDLGTDVDDVGMLCAAHALADLGEARILAVTHSTNMNTGVGAIYAINQYFHRDDIALGGYHGAVGMGGGQPGWTHEGRGVYVDQVVEEFEPRIRTYDQVPLAAEVYRHTLKMADDGSVTIVCAGHLTNLFDLLQTEADEALVARKVRQLVVMGGKPSSGGAEWNWAGCGGRVGDCGNYDRLGAITYEALHRWPKAVPVFYLGYEAGLDVHTGLGNVKRNSDHSPCDRAFSIYCNAMESWCAGGGRRSWDSMALLYAVRGDPHGYYTLEPGVYWIDSRTGRAEWQASALAADEDSVPGTQLVLLKDRAASLASELNDLYMHLPAETETAIALEQASATPPPPPCQLWCVDNRNPWRHKCTKFSSCAGCYQCSDVLSPSPPPLAPP
eukprot:6163020-Prymnesium_polylepis.1